MIVVESAANVKANVLQSVECNNDNTTDSWISGTVGTQTWFSIGNADSNTYYGGTNIAGTRALPSNTASLPHWFRSYYTWSRGQ